MNFDQFHQRPNFGIIRGRNESPRFPQDTRYLVARMTSNKKIESNRKNAIKSSGPKSERGKSMSRQNALKFGAFSRLPLILGEDVKEHAELVQSIKNELGPETTLESMLADQIIGQLWRLRRLELAEHAYFREMLRARYTRLLPSLSEKEFEEVKVKYSDQAIMRQVIDNFKNQQSDPFGSTSLEKLIAESMKAARNSSEKNETDRRCSISLVEKFAYAEDLEELLLEGFASPQSQLIYTHIDRLRRSLVRDVLQMYQSFAELREQRLTVQNPVPPAYSQRQT